MTVRCDICQRDFTRDLDRGCLAWAPTSPRGPVQGVWVVCSPRCLEAIDDPKMLFCDRGLRKYIGPLGGAFALAKLTSGHLWSREALDRLTAFSLVMRYGAPLGSA